MAQITGTVRCLQVTDDFAFTMIDPAAGLSEIFILWWFPGTGGGIPQDITAYSRIMHSMWVSLLREAHANGLNVTILHPDASAVVTTVRLGVL